LHVGKHAAIVCELLSWSAVISKQGRPRKGRAVTDLNEAFRPQQTLAQLKNSLPRLFPGATAGQNNIIVGPTSETTQFVRLDDLDEARLI
jgi:hypothetical protein